MKNEDALLLRTQEQVQRSLSRDIDELLGRRADESEWDAWTSSIRDASEEAWDCCNAFLIAHTMARFLACSVPTSTRPRNPWVTAFVDAVTAADSHTEILLWTNAPADDPRANAVRRATTALPALTRALRNSRLLDDNRPGPFPQAVWLATDSRGRQSDVGDDLS